MVRRSQQPQRVALAAVGQVSRRLRPVTRGLLAVTAAGLTLWMAPACMTPPLTDPARNGPFHVPLNHTGVAQLPFTLRRVVLLPAAGGAVAPAESTVELDPVLAAALQRQNRFEVVALTRDECRSHFHVPEFSSTAALPHDFVEILRRDYGADGVLFVDLTVFKPYRPLALGVRAKLAAFDGDVRLLWSFDNLFSAADPAVANAARNHYLNNDRNGIPADFTEAALQSPSRFGGYVAAEMFETLPPVYTPPRTAKK